MKGMEEFFFSEGRTQDSKMHPFLPDEYFVSSTQGMQFGEGFPLEHKLFLACLGDDKDSMTRRIFKHNLDKKIEDFVNFYGVKPHERGLNELIEEEKERMAKEAILRE